jgi:hypothetical protein
MSLCTENFVARQLLGRHVGRRAGARLPPRGGIRQHRETEVGDARFPLRVEDDVGRLEIAMQDAAFVGRREPGAQLAAHFERFVLRQPSDAPAAATPGRRHPPDSIDMYGWPSIWPTS